MNQETYELWLRALRSYKTASKLAEEDPDAAASRAYYAAFYAVSTLFARKARPLQNIGHWRPPFIVIWCDQKRGRRIWEQPSPGWSACAGLEIMAGGCTYR